MSDRIIVMHKGRVEQDGTPEDLYYRPSNRFVAEFIGETNFLSGKVISLNNSIVGFDGMVIKFLEYQIGVSPKRDQILRQCTSSLKT